MWESSFSPGVAAIAYAVMAVVSLTALKLKGSPLLNSTAISGALVLASLTLLATAASLVASRNNIYVTLASTQLLLSLSSKQRPHKLAFGVFLALQILFSLVAIRFHSAASIELHSLVLGFCIDVFLGAITAAFLMFIQTSINTSNLSNPAPYTSFYATSSNFSISSLLRRTYQYLVSFLHILPSNFVIIVLLYAAILSILFTFLCVTFPPFLAQIPSLAVPMPPFHSFDVRITAYNLVSSHVPFIRLLLDLCSQFSVAFLIIVLLTFYDALIAWSSYILAFYTSLVITAICSPANVDTAALLISSNPSLYLFLFCFALSTLFFFCYLPSLMDSPQLYVRSEFSLSVPSSPTPDSIKLSLGSPRSSQNPPLPSEKLSFFYINKLMAISIFVLSTISFIYVYSIQANNPLYSSSWSTSNTRGNNKWIVVTTINEPSTTLESLCSLPDWEVVVVADSKTPKNWSSGPACHFLSLDAQALMPFSIVKYIPLKAYTRKNLGYLYAIAHGAEIIFDTDDDNLPNRPIALHDIDDISGTAFTFQPDPEVSSAVNPYAHFARPDIWPRGYPLDQYDTRKPLHYASFPKANQSRVNVDIPDSLGGRALIQQYLADLDPDVDAVFRLLNPEDIAQVHFCQEVPPLRLSRGIMAPFNSQNTLWHKDAFWGLLLPITVTFRVTDILRGYWVQRLLWDVGGTLEFGSPTVDQIRNPHNYLEDFESEIQLYMDGPRLIDFLRHWKFENSGSGGIEKYWERTKPDERQSDLSSRIVNLMKSLEKEGFVKKGDVDLARAWVSDLEAVGYNWPITTEWSQEQANAQSKILGNEEFENNVPSLLRPVNAKWNIDSVCNEHQKNISNHFKDVLVVVVLNTKAAYTAVPGYLEIYGSFFSNIVFYGEEDAIVDGTKVHAANIRAGELGYRAFISAIESEIMSGRYGQWKGILYTNDDLPMNPFALATLNLDKLWLSKDFAWGAEKVVHRKLAEDKWWLTQEDLWWQNYTMAFEDGALDEVYKERLLSYGNGELVMFYGQNDFWYLPTRLGNEFLNIMKIYSSHEVWHEIIFQTIIRMLPENEIDYNIPDGRSIWLWKEDRNRYAEWLIPRTYFFHPVKLKGQRERLEIKEWILNSRDAWNEGSLIL